MSRCRAYEPITHLEFINYIVAGFLGGPVAVAADVEASEGIKRPATESRSELSSGHCGCSESRNPRMSAP